VHEAPVKHSVSIFIDKDVDSTRHSFVFQVREPLSRSPVAATPVPENLDASFATVHEASEYISTVNAVAIAGTVGTTRAVGAAVGAFVAAAVLARNK
jgi:hypothetical protein